MIGIPSNVLAQLKTFGTTVRVFLGMRNDIYTFSSNMWVNNNATTDLGVALRFKKDISADFLRSNSQKIEAEIRGSYDLTGKEILATFKIEWRVGGNLQSYSIPIGVFVPVQWHIDSSTGNTIISEGYDRLFTFQQLYDKEFSESITFPISVKDFLLSLVRSRKCNVEFPYGGNLNKILDYDIYKGIDGYTYRAVLDDILQGTGLSARYTPHQNKVTLFSAGQQTDKLELTETDFNQLKVGELQKAFNVVNLAREPQHDNYFYPDPLPENKVEIVIPNNLLSDMRRVGGEVISLRAEYAPNILSRVSYISYREFNSTTWGFPQLEALDRVRVSGVEGVSAFDSYVMKSTLTWDGGLTQTIEAVPSQYLKEKYALITDRERAGIKTEILVDKQAGEIKLLTEQVATKATIYRQPTAPANPQVDDIWLNTVENQFYKWSGTEWQSTNVGDVDLTNYYTKEESNAQIELKAGQILSTVSQVSMLVGQQGEELAEVKNRMTSINQSVEAVELSVKGSGGNNLLLNSVGLKGSLNEWQVATGTMTSKVVDPLTSLPNKWNPWNSNASASGSGLSLSLTSTGYQQTGVSSLKKYSLEKPLSVEIGSLNLNDGYFVLEAVFQQGMFSINVSIGANIITTGYNDGSGWKGAGYITKTNQKYIRLRYELGVVYFEASNNNLNYTVISSVPYEKIDITKATVSLWLWNTGAGSAIVKNLSQWSYSEATNNGEIVSTIDVQENTDSRSAIQLSNQWIGQAVSVINGDKYTISFRYKKLDSDNNQSRLHLGDEEIIITSENEQLNKWYEFSYTFFASGSSLFVRLSNTLAGNARILLSDIILKAGGVGRWKPAINETYGKTYKFDEEGLKIGSDSSLTESLLNESKLSFKGKNSSKSILYLDKDSSFLTKLTVQDEFTIQRYNNPEKSTRIIPTDTGCMLVVNN